MKQYNLGGIGKDVELGKKGRKIIGSNSSQIAFVETGGTSAKVSLAAGTAPTHGVRLDQLEEMGSKNLARVDKMVNYDDGTVLVGTADANVYIHKVAIESDVAWTNANDATTITVGDSADPDRLFTAWDPSCQTIDETDHRYTSQTAINAYVTQGAATAGTARVVVWFSGIIDQ